MHGQQIHPSGQMVGNPPGNAAVVPSATIIIAQPPSQTKVENYKCEAAVRLGICQIALGILAIGLNIALYTLNTAIVSVIFNSLMFILTGSFQIASGKNNTKCWVITTMVFCILSALFASAAVISGSLGLAFNDHVDEDKEGYHDASYGLSGTIALIGLIELVISIVSATFTCAACSGQSAQQQGVVISQQTQYVTQPGQQQMIMTQPACIYPGSQTTSFSAPAYSYQPASSPPPAYSYATSDPAQEESKRDLST